MIDYTKWTADELRRGAEMCEDTIINVLRRSPRCRSLYDIKRRKIAEHERARICGEIERRVARRALQNARQDAMWA